MKRILSLILALVLIVSLIPAAQAAPGGFSQAVGCNPLYPSGKLPEAGQHPASQMQPQPAWTDFLPFQDAAVLYREAMENRETTITLYLRVTDPNFDPYADFIPELMELAFAETGVPTEGDSLRWVWDTYWANWSWSPSSSGWDITVNIDMTYYTTFAQEQELTNKVDQILDGFGFTEDTSDYRKVKTIYDYITSHVDYDYEHLPLGKDYPLIYTAYAAACHGTSVCQGYAVLFYRLALEEGICARVITGDGGGPHAWNIVELESQFYNLDATWDEDMLEYGYNYFLRCPSNFYGHTREYEYDTTAFHRNYPMAASDYVPPHEHTYSAWTVTDPTCTQDGSRVRTCSGCGNVDTVVIPALGHDYTAAVTDPTCEAPGYTTHTCSRCADSYTDSHTEALGHDWDEGFITIEPDESAGGLLVYTCVRCAAQRQQDLAPHAHGYTEITVTDPGCETEGFTTHTCPGCGHFYTDTYTAPLGHDWELDHCIRCGGERPVPFEDTKPGSFYYLPMLWALDRGITKGTSATAFSPDVSCTRAQAVTFLWRAAGSPEPESLSHPFTDVNEKAFYYKAMLWAVENGITSGMSADSFAPDVTCTRGQVVTFLWRAKEKPAPAATEHPFTDVSQDAFYYDAMLWAVENGITSGMSADSFAPGNPCTRGQVVTFLYRAFQ